MLRVTAGRGRFRRRAGGSEGRSTCDQLSSFSATSPGGNLSPVMRRSVLLPLRAASRPVPTFRSRPAIRRNTRRTLVSAADIEFGQPLHETHPHIIRSGERKIMYTPDLWDCSKFAIVTPGITALEYHHRRAALAQKLPRNSIAVLAASNLKYRSGPVFYEFHQEPNFFYLTGTTIALFRSTKSKRLTRC